MKKIFTALMIQLVGSTFMFSIANAIPQIIFDTSASVPKVALPIGYQRMDQYQTSTNPAVQYMSANVVRALGNLELQGPYTLLGTPAGIYSGTFLQECRPNINFVLNPSYLASVCTSMRRAYVPRYVGYTQINLNEGDVETAALQYFKTMGLVKGDSRFDSMVIYDPSFGLMMSTPVAAQIITMAGQIMQARSNSNQSAGVWADVISVAEVALIAVAPQFAVAIGAVGGAETAELNGQNVLVGAVKGGATGYVTSSIAVGATSNATINAAINSAVTNAAVQAINNNGKININSVGLAALGGAVSFNVNNTTNSILKAAGSSPQLASFVSMELGAAAGAAAQGGNGNYIMQSVFLAGISSAITNSVQSQPYYVFQAGQMVSTPGVYIVYLDPAGVAAMCGDSAEACTITTPSSDPSKTNPVIILNSQASPAMQLTDFTHEYTHAINAITNGPLNINFFSNKVITYQTGPDGYLTQNPMNPYGYAFNMSELPAFLNEQATFYTSLQSANPNSVNDLVLNASQVVPMYNSVYNAASYQLASTSGALLPQNITALQSNPLGAFVPMVDSIGNYTYTACLEYDPALMQVKFGYTGGINGETGRWDGLTISTPELGTAPTNQQIVAALTAKIGGAMNWMNANDPSGTYYQNLQAYNARVAQNAQQQAAMKANQNMLNTNQISYSVAAYANYHGTNSSTTTSTPPPVVSCNQTRYSPGQTISCKITNADANTVCAQAGTSSTVPNTCVNAGWVLNSSTHTLSLSKQDTNYSGQFGIYTLSAVTAAGGGAVTISY